jgi:hypothetical protein
MKAKALKVVQRLMNSALVGCFERWHDKTAEELRKRHVMTKIVLRTLQQSLSHALERWIEAVEEVAAARVEEERKRWEGPVAAGKRAEEKRKRAVVSKIVLRMSHQTVSRALDRWMEHIVLCMNPVHGSISSSSSSIRWMELLLLRMNLRVLCVSWEFWHELVEVRLARILLETPAIAKGPLGGVGIWLASAPSRERSKKIYVKGLVPGSPAQLSVIAINDVLVRVDKFECASRPLTTGPGLFPGLERGAQAEHTKLSNINSLIRGPAGTFVELEFLSETGKQKIVTLRRVATAEPPSPPSALHQSPWGTRENKRMSTPSYSDMKTPREKLLFAQFSSLAVSTQ